MTTSTSSTMTLSDTTTDFSEFVTQFNASLSAKDTWAGTLTTQTSQTLVELVATLGAFDNAKLLRYYEDSFPDTVQSDGAIRAIAVMQGIRLTRKLPAVASFSITSTADVTVEAYAQFMISGYYFFNREQITLTANVAKTVDLYQGQINSVSMTGLGTDFQVFLSTDDSFKVSDQDVTVVINNTLIPKAYGGLWNYEDAAGYSDLTHPDGRLLIQFGSTTYGTVPLVNDVITVIYVTTLGADGNALAIKGSEVALVNSSLISGKCLSTPTGGAAEKNTLAYKNVEAGAFGAYASAVTRDQYRALVNTYPGVTDAITQSQREINPMKLEWMNVIRVSALTSTEWTDAQKKTFCTYCQDQTMYSPRFLWQDPIAVPRDVKLEIFCYNTAVLSVVKSQAEAAITALFEPRPGLLQTNFYASDLDAVIRKASSGAVSYVKVSSPLEDMVVTAPASPELTATVIPGAGTLVPLLYAYGVSVVLESGDEGSPKNWVFPQVLNGYPGGVTLNWETMSGVKTYKVWGRKAGSIGLLAELDSSVLTWHDDGSVTPSGSAPNSLSELPIRYNYLRSLSVTVSFADRQQRFDV